MGELFTVALPRLNAGVLTNFFSRTPYFRTDRHHSLKLSEVCICITLHTGGGGSGEVGRRGVGGQFAFTWEVSYFLFVFRASQGG